MSLFISSLTCLLFRSVLFNICKSVNFLASLMLLISSFTPTWAEKIPDMILSFLNLQRFVLWPIRIYPGDCSLCTWEKKKCILLLLDGCSVSVSLVHVVQSIVLDQCYLIDFSVWILSESGALKSPTNIALLSISPFKFVHISLNILRYSNFGYIYIYDSYSFLMNWPPFMIVFTWNTFFHSFNLSPQFSLKQKLISCRQQIVGLCFLICLATLCLWIRQFNSITFRVITDRQGLTNTILLVVFCFVVPLFLSSSLIAFLCELVISYSSMIWFPSLNLLWVYGSLWLQWGLHKIPYRYSSIFYVAKNLTSTAYKTYPFTLLSLYDFNVSTDLFLYCICINIIF